MATCTVCGKWAGVGKSKHDNCVPSDTVNTDERLRTSSTALYSRAAWLRPVFMIAGMGPGVVLLAQTTANSMLWLPFVIIWVGFGIGAVLADILVNLLRTVALTSDLLASRK